MQKLRPDLNIGGNIQKIRYDRKLTQDQVIAKMNLMGIQISKIQQFSHRHAYRNAGMRKHRAQGRHQR